MFVSTRGVSTASFVEMVQTGFCADGGILLPREVHVFGERELWELKEATFGEVCYAVLSKYCPESEIPAAELRELVVKAHAGFGHADVISVVPCQDGVSVAELFHGPTHAFKDLAMCVVARLLSYALKKEGKRATCLISTTGDTGPSAISALRQTSNVEVAVLYPLWPAISRIQEQQMISVRDANVHVVGTRTSADENDEAMRKLFSDQELVTQHGLTTINSINCCRILCSVAHFVFLYLRIAQTPSDKVVFAIPSGALGNSTACVLAKLSGVPIEKILACNNHNDVMHRLLRDGEYEERALMPSLAPATDAQSPYNLERILYMLDSARTVEWMTVVQRDRRWTMPAEPLAKLRGWMCSVSVSDAQIEATIAETWQRSRYLLCPHTACGVYGAQQFKFKSHVVCLATAHPAKFRETVKQVTQVDPPLPFGLRFCRGVDFDKIDYADYNVVVSEEKTVDGLVALVKRVLIGLK
jgi:threonine synthase